MKGCRVEMALIAILVLLAASWPDHGQDPPGTETMVALPGGDQVDASRLTPYQVVWVQYFDTDTDRTLRRTIVDRVEREVSPDGGSHLVRTQTFLGLDGESTSRRVNRVDGVTLTPRRERWRFGERVTHVDYVGTRVSGAMLEGSEGEDAATLFNEDLAQPGFDFNTVPLVLAATELKEGVALRFPHVRMSPPTFETRTLGDDVPI